MYPTTKTKHNARRLSSGEYTCSCGRTWDADEGAECPAVAEVRAQCDKLRHLIGAHRAAFEAAARRAGYTNFSTRRDGSYAHADLNIFRSGYLAGRAAQ